MVIDKKFFDECFCPVQGIGRVCLRGDRSIPKFLEDYGREKDGNEYDSSCFSIDIMIENEKPIGGVINYMAEHEMWSEIPCDNYIEAFDYYKANTTDRTWKETIK